MESKVKTCCFFGHSNSPKTIYNKLQQTIESLIVNDGVSNFYVGTHGSFDAMSHKILKLVKEDYPFINYGVVLAYLPPKKNEYFRYSNTETLYPSGIEDVPKRFAIDFRNKWMVKHSDIIVCFITFDIGGAYKYVNLAKHQNKRIINLFNKKD